MAIIYLRYLIWISSIPSIRKGIMDTCIAIRMAYKKNGKVFVRSGAGIVADSVPEREYEECLNKAKATLKALELAEEVEE